MNKYEIEHVNFPGYHFESEIAMLTGLGFEDIRLHTEKITVWRGRVFVELFQDLGYSCNNRFIKFNKDTPYPCMIRCKIPNDKRHWAGWVYYDGHVYDVREGKLTWAQWNEWWPNYRVTSMLQVWISLDSKLNELTDHHG